MRKIIFIAILSILASSADAQIFDRYKRGLNNAEEKQGAQLKEGWDIVLDPIEQVPKSRTSRNVATAQTNWGVDLLLTATLKQRIREECNYKVTVKVADTGEADHRDLLQGKLQGRNYTTDATVADGNGHGTHVAGIIAGDGIGLCDVLVDKGLLKHQAIKVLNNSGSGSFDWVKNAVSAERTDDQAILNRGEFVVWNGSFGGGTSLISNVEAELQKSTDAGVYFVFAAGNTGTTGVNYPGNGKYSIAVASLDQALTRSSYSTMGPEVWVGMPGRNIVSTYKGNTYASLSGTSMASPFGAAATAVALSKWGPKLKGLARMRAYLAWCARDILPTGKDNETGYGLALIQNILDRDPANTPGLPTEPPPPPPPPGSGFQSVTPLTIAMTRDIVVNWDNLSAASSQTATTFKTAGRGSKKSNQGLALKQVKVRFEIRFESKGEVGAEAKRMEASVEKYFQSRGFLLAAGQDESFAAVWAGYFLEMGLLQEGYKGARVTQLSHNSAGVQVVTKDPVLKHFPPGS